MKIGFQKKDLIHAKSMSDYFKIFSDSKFDKEQQEILLKTEKSVLATIEEAKRELSKIDNLGDFP